MTRIFLRLAWLTAAALVVTYAVGVASWWRDAVRRPDDSLYLLHFYLGLGTTVGGCLVVHCLIFIYFLGTGRWVKEVKLAYELPDEPWPLLTRELKRKTFPVALAAMLITIATAAAGMGAQMQEWPWPVHATLATLTLVVNLWAFRVEYRNVAINGGAIDAVMAEVDRLRAERGLPTNAEALREQESGNQESGMRP